jgi:hypothetical protein
VRLAKSFLLAARLSNAHLIESGKLPALASFRAVWKSGNAAGAVKIIPPGPSITGIGIASDLISVDPQSCKDNFAAARSSGVIDGSTVFAVVLSCTLAQKERTTQYFITPRQKGGFVVFAVIGDDADHKAGPGLEKLDALSKAAVQAAAPED